MNDALDRLKQACVLVKSPASKGTAYLVSPTQLATCHHVVESAGLKAQVELLLEGGPVAATVHSWDEKADCALLEVTEPLPGKKALDLAGSCAHKSAWDGYGYPALAEGEGVAFFGTVTDPEARDDKHRPMITLYSDQLAAGLAAPVNGLSGGPVLVGGAVVGHFSRVLATPLTPGQPALGVIYASRAASVLALLGKAPAVKVAVSPPVADLASKVPPIGPDEYHAFISYRSTDRPFATALHDRLAAVGLKVFLDQNELVPGDQLVGTLHAALARSRCGIVLVSNSWTQSPWCLEEGNTLVKRAIEHEGQFRVIPLRLEKVDMPGMLDGRFWLDFAGEAAPSGRKLEQVIYAVLGKAAPAEGSVDQKVQTTLTDATDGALRLMDQMLREPRNFKTLVDFMKRSGLPEIATRFRAGEALIGANKQDPALELLPPATQSTRACQLRALALSRAGRHEEARALLEPLVERGQIDSETGGILGGIYKRIWLATGDRGYLIKSFEMYQVTYTTTAHYYPGINVATLALMLDDPQESRRVAMAVRDDLGARSFDALEEWQRATLGEAFLLLDELEQAAKWYRHAVALGNERPADIATMRRQARMILEKKGTDKGTLDPSLPVPSVVTFSGHLTDTPGRAVPRFPENKAIAVGRAIEKFLKKNGAVHAVCSAARGGDLLFLEQVLERRGTASVFLPFPPDDFKKASVGQGWDPRFDAVLANGRVDVRPPLFDKLPPENERGAAFEACNQALIKEAQRLAQQFDDDDPVLLTVWNGRPGDGAGGTAHAVATWKEYGYRHENIDISKL